MFTCETDGGISNWIVNGSLPEALPSNISESLNTSKCITNNGSTILELVIQARAEYNGTIIFQCLVVESGSSTAQSATLTIQGITYSFQDAGVYMLLICLRSTVSRIKCKCY